MYITRDYLKVGSWQAIIDMVNDKYNFQLYPGITKLKEMKRLGPTRTQIEIIPNRSTSATNLLPDITQTVFTYDRLNCTDFFRNTIAVDIRGLKLPITTLDILKQIGDRNEIVFEPDDFVQQTFQTFTDPNEDDYVIQADDRSLRFVGHLKVRLYNTLKIDLTPLVTPVNEFPNTFWKPQPDKIRGDYYLTRYDFTGHREVFKDLAVGLYNNPKRLLGALYKTTGVKFDASLTPSPLNIVNQVVDGEMFVKVLYNGAVIPKWSVRNEFQRVLVIELSETMTTGIRGCYRIHYD